MRVELGFDGARTVHHARFGEGAVMSTDEDRVTVLFARHGYRTLSLEAVREHGLLRSGAAGDRR